MRIRKGGSEDYDAILAMGDEAVAWLVTQGRTGQWGTKPWTGNPRREQLVRERAAGEGLWIAETDDGEPVGVLVITEERQPYVPPVDERELYVNLLLSSRKHAGEGVGTALLRHTEEEARGRGIDLIRVDCYAGDDGALVRYYEGQGFTSTLAFTADDDWPGRLLERRLSAS